MHGIFVLTENTCEWKIYVQYNPKQEHILEPLKPIPPLSVGIINGPNTETWNYWMLYTVLRIFTNSYLLVRDIWLPCTGAAPAVLWADAIDATLPAELAELDDSIVCAAWTVVADEMVSIISSALTTDWKCWQVLWVTIWGVKIPRLSGSITCTFVTGRRFCRVWCRQSLA